MSASRAVAILTGLLLSLVGVAAASGQPPGDAPQPGGFKKKAVSPRTGTFGGGGPSFRSGGIGDGPGPRPATPLGRTVHIRVYLVSVTGKPGQEKTIDPGSLRGSAVELPARLREWQRGGTLVGVRRIDLATTDGEQAMAATGAMKPYVTGSARTASGLVQRSTTFRDIGTKVQATPALGPDGLVSLRLQVTDEQPLAGTTGPASAGDNRDATTPAAEFTNLHVTAALRVPPGQVALVHASLTDTKAGQAQTVILASVTVEEGPPAAAK
jgi:hypothetical protein